MLTAGFDLDASHLVAFADEEVDYGNPSIAAKDVVDRDTLKAFVTEAGNYYIDRFKAGGPEAGTRLRLAMRDPNGPWRHGSVYLYVWNLVDRTTLFHAGFPNTYELQPLRPVARDAATGEFILPQLIEAAESGPEGGFVDYHFDDPNDAFDSADVQKIGYVREFQMEISRPDGSTVQVPLVFGSGFYRRPSQVSQSTVVEAVLPQIMRSVTASTVDAVSSRIEHAASPTGPAVAFSLGGASTLPDALRTNGPALADDAIDLDRLLANSSFTIPINPYVGWQMPGGMSLWSMAGYGFGKVEVDDKAAPAQESDLNQRMFAAGLKGTLASSDQLIPGGATNLNVKGEVAFTWADVEGAGSIEEMALQVGRQRFLLESAHVRKLDSGATFTSSLEAGLRNDTGDGETGTGAEVGGALRYENPASRLTVEGRVRSLVGHSDDTAEAGVSGLVRIASNASGHGLALAVEPSWGRTDSSVRQLWESGIGAGTAGGNQARLNAEAGYGFDAPKDWGVW